MSKKIGKEQVLMIVLTGILLVVIAIPIPDTNREKLETERPVLEMEGVVSTEERLKQILQKISGVGRAEVFITYEDEGRIIIEKDQDRSEELIQETDSNGGTRKTTTTRNTAETVYDGEDHPYIIQELSPTVQGILVVAEGAGNQSVKMQIQETIEALFGLDSHKISIMKMEVTR